LTDTTITTRNVGRRKGEAQCGRHIRSVGLEYEATVNLLEVQVSGDVRVDEKLHKLSCNHRPRTTYNTPSPQQDTTTDIHAVTAFTVK
jgi:hypothetical protein